MDIWFGGLRGVTVQASGCGASASGGDFANTDVESLSILSDTCALPLLPCCSAEAAGSGHNSRGRDNHTHYRQRHDHDHDQDHGDDDNNGNNNNL